MIQGLVQTLLVRLPLAYYMSIQPDASLTKIGLAAPVATIFGIVLNVIFYLWMNQKNVSVDEEYNIPITVDTRISVVPTFRTPSPFVSLFINTPLSNTFFLDTLFQM